MEDGIIVIDKPAGFTSHDVVAKTRGILKMKKIGHSGTLDPMATGVLPLFLGYATGACDRMPNHDKAYTAILKLGATTDTQDTSGTTLAKREVTVGRAEVETALEQFLGETQQCPPMYSAVKIDGKRLYSLARQGIEVERPKRPITVYNIKLTESDEENHLYTFEISCSKGTYVRTICHDIGEMLGCGAAMAGLRRTNSSGFLEKDCITLPQLEELVESGKLEERVIPVEQVFLEYEKVVLTRELTQHFLNGVPLWLNQLEVEPNDQMLRIYNDNCVFLGIARANKEKRQLADQKQFVGRNFA